MGDINCCNGIKKEPEIIGESVLFVNDTQIVPKKGRVGSTQSLTIDLKNEDKYFSKKNDSPTLLLEIILSPIEKTEKFIKICPTGIVNIKNSQDNNRFISSLRNKNDGVTYFGLSLEERDVQYNEDLDIILFQSDTDFNELKKCSGTSTMLGQFFKIYYNKDNRKYYIKDCELGTGTFIQVDKEIPLKMQNLFLIGNSYISAQIGNLEGVKDFNKSSISKVSIISPSDQNIISIKVAYDNYEDENPLIFDKSKKIIKIGKDNICDVLIEDDSLRNIHCSIVYKEDAGWFMIDGIVKEIDDNMETINSCHLFQINKGTWIFANDDIEIWDGMVFKSNNYCFKCNL